MKTIGKTLGVLSLAGLVLSSGCCKEEKLNYFERAHLQKARELYVNVGNNLVCRIYPDKGLMDDPNGKRVLFIAMMHKADNGELVALRGWSENDEYDKEKGFFQQTRWIKYTLVKGLDEACDICDRLPDKGLMDNID